MLHINVATKDLMDRGLTLQKLSAEDQQVSYEYFMQQSLIIIDEISTVSSGMLGQVNHRLQQIMNSDKDYGGIQVLVLGDFFQFPAFGLGKPLYASVFDNNTLLPAKANKTSAATNMHYSGLSVHFSLEKSCN